MPKTSAAYSTRISLYLKVANILRSRILKGDWRKGDRLPNILVLCEEFNVGRITVRQALKLLAEEGLIDSRRGRGTFVAAGQTNANPKQAIIDDLKEAAQNIKILEISDARPLPDNLLGIYESNGNYVRIRKLRYHKKTPYCVMDIYVTEDLFRQFPKDALSKQTVASLVHQYSKDPITSAKQILGINIADYETADLLDCQMSAPVAEFDRYFINAHNQLISRGHYLYRGDLFYMETEHMGDPVSDHPAGWLPDVKSEQT